MTRPHPVPDPDTAPFWYAVEAGELRLPHCPACERPSYPPGPCCPSCRRPTDEWRTLSGDGALWSWTTVHLRLVPGCEPPWTVAEVQLSEHPDLRVVGHLAPGVEPCIGLPLRLSAATGGHLVWETR